MRKWHAIFEDDPQTDKDVEEPLKRFEDAATAGEINGRKVIAMWIIDEATEQADVIKVAGRVPGNIARRHDAWKSRQ